MKACTRFLMLLTIALTVGGNALADPVTCTVSDVRHRIYRVTLDRETLEMSVKSAFGFAVEGIAKELRSGLVGEMQYQLDFFAKEQGKLIPQQFAIQDPSPVRRWGTPQTMLHIVHGSENLSRPCTAQ